jgi:hypothetical protein
VVLCSVTGGSRTCPKTADFVILMESAGLGAGRDLVKDQGPATQGDSQEARDLPGFDLRNLGN